jgi:hypothetical protein
MTLLGYDAKLYCEHSGKRGGATAAANNGANDKAHEDTAQTARRLAVGYNACKICWSFYISSRLSMSELLQKVVAFFFYFKKRHFSILFQFNLETSTLTVSREPNRENNGLQMSMRVNGHDISPSLSKSCPSSPMPSIQERKASQWALTFSISWWS